MKSAFVIVPMLMCIFALPDLWAIKTGPHGLQKNAPMDSMKQTIPVFSYRGMDFNAFLSENLAYPSRMRRKGISCRLQVEFVVDTLGRVADPVCKDSTCSDYLLFFEEVRKVLIKTSFYWTPARVNGKPVSMRMRIPVRFEMEN